VELDPAGRAALTVATEAMIAQAHYESAGKEQTKAATVGAASPGLALLAAHLRNDSAAVTQWSAATTASSTFVDAWYYLTYLGDRGRLADAQAFGAGAAQRFATQSAVASSGILLRSRLAAMEAMAGHCNTDALPVTDAGDMTKYYAGLASAWCKRPFAENAPEDADLNAMVRAAALWSGGDAFDALNLLKEDKPNAQSMVATLIRGEAHLKSAQQVLAIGDFKAVITRRGEALMTGTLVYPVAQAGLAAAYSTMGDDPNASRAENDLQQLWQDADASEPLLHTKGK
jgi:serine/threonine-protein kinase